ncbi:MAG: hypothetical protein Tsb002_12630 [Wenzhouxiangellaceae bacterium]
MNGLLSALCSLSAFNCRWLAPLALTLLCGCAGQAYRNASPADYQPVTNPHFAAIAAAPQGHARDRQAILAMRGDYRVDFQFEETVRLASGYERRDDKTTGGYETVLVIADEPDFVSLQHILVTPGGHVVKHWRQDWHYQADHRFEFVADQTWRVVPLEAESGAWTQCVFEVSDAPRYCGTGRWNHHYGVSTWTSDRSWRPLPRREYTIREDYNALNAENRHTVTPHGWTHEQDNTKVRRQGERTEQTLVREFGFNDYRSISGYDFSPALAYWQRTASYWQMVRSAWERRLQPGQELRLLTAVDGMPIIEATFAQAAEVTEDNAAQISPSQVEAVLDQHTEVHAARPLAQH